MVEMKLNILLLALMACITCYAEECKITDTVVGRKGKIKLMLIDLSNLPDSYKDPFSYGREGLRDTHSVEFYHRLLRELDDCILMPYGQ